MKSPCWFEFSLACEGLMVFLCILVLKWANEAICSERDLAETAWPLPGAPLRA